VAKRAPAKKAVAKRAPAQKTVAKKTLAKRAPAKKAAAKRAPAKRLRVVPPRGQERRPERARSAQAGATQKSARARSAQAGATRGAVSPQRRLVALLVLMVLALAAIFVRLVDVQAVEGDHYEAMAMAQRVRSVSLTAERGTIFDRDGNELALSVPQQTVYADPRVVKDPERYARKLAPIVDVDQSDLRDRLAARDLAFVYVARKVDDRTAARVKKLALPGVAFITESKRFYPADSLAGPVVGFSGTDDKGLSGLEEKFDSLLRGKTGRLVAEEDPNGREIPATQRTAEPAERGGDLVLTLDQSLQFEVEKQLVAGVNGANARGGMAIVADVRTGDVLAMASVRGRGARLGAGLAPSTDVNRPLTTVYEPGSTAKVITVAGALESNVVEPATPFYVEENIDIADKTFHDAEWHRPESWDVSEIVRRSSNVGVIRIAERLGKERLDYFQRRFGFGTKTPIDFPAESPGIIKDVNNYVSTDMGSVPIGYTTAVTPMQMLDVFVTIANGGMSRPPRLVAGTIDADGVRRERHPKRGMRIVSAQTAAEVNEMLRGVVRDGGTGDKAQIDGYTVAGKTGTSRKHPYESARYMASFAGFAPAEAPRLAAIIVIDQPGTKNNQYYGGKVAAPLFASIMKYALRLESVPPSGMLSAVASSPGPAVEVARKPEAPPAPATPPSGQAVAPPAGNVANPVP
jgi:cell division protein FtsI (penicillin-binding protein 3)